MRLKPITTRGDRCRPGAGGSGEAEPAGEIPLADPASLALRAGRMGPVLPHMGWMIRFPDVVDEADLAAEAVRLAMSPYALGRRVRRARLPGGRHRWVVSRQPSEVRVPGERLDQRGLEAWLDGELVRPLDPEHGLGWHLSAVHTAEGDTVVLVLVHHLFGTGPGILHAAYGDGSGPPWRATTEMEFGPGNTYDLGDELRGIGERLHLGVLGAARLAADAVRRLPSTRVRRRTATTVEADPPPLRPARGVDPTRRGPSSRRVAAVTSLPAPRWDAAAGERGGTGNTLLAAVAANLVRRARRNRGGDVGRPVRLVLPVDLGEDPVGARRDGASGPRAPMTTASVVFPGGDPDHRDLTVMRRWMKAAFQIDSDTAPPVRGINDAARLLPESLTIRLAKRGALAFDACASNPGMVPAGAYRLAGHRARDCAVIGFPIGMDLIVVLSRTADTVCVSTMADPGRLGPGADYRAWFREELGAWGLPDRLW